MPVHRPLERGRVHEAVSPLGLQGQSKQCIVQDGLAAAAATAAATRPGRRSLSRIGGVWFVCMLFLSWSREDGGGGEGGKERGEQGRRKQKRKKHKTAGKGKLLRQQKRLLFFKVTLFVARAKAHQSKQVFFSFGLPFPTAWQGLVEKEDDKRPRLTELIGSSDRVFSYRSVLFPWQNETEINTRTPCR